MSHQKPYRRTNQTSKPPKDDFQIDPKYRNGVLKLQELFPTWTEFDLQSSLMEVNGDVETAIIRISEGHSEQWGSVSRKKGGKQGTPIPPSSSGSVGGAPAHRERDSSRGGHRGSQRGGRGGGRGGRGGSFTGRPAPRNQPAQDGPSTQLTTAEWTAATGKAPETGTSADTSESHHDTQTPETNGQASGDETAATTVPETKVEKSEPQVPPQTNGITKTATPSPRPVKAAPAGGPIRSWAQVARPQEKPKSIPPVQQDESSSAPEPVAPEPESQHQKAEVVREEPTTAQAPIWDEEPARVTAHKAESKDILPASPPVQESSTYSENASPLVDQSTPALTSDASSTVPSSAASPTPHSKAVAAKPTVATSRVASRFKPDQAVVMPSFGTVGSGIGIGGMKFGSLSISDDVDAPTDAPESEPVPIQASIPVSAPPAAVPVAPVTSSPAVPHSVPIITPTPAEPLAPLQPQPTAPAPGLTASQPFLPPTQLSEPLAQTLSTASAAFTPQSTTLASLASSAAAASGIFQPHPTTSALQSSIHPATSTQSSSTPFSSFSPLGQANATSQASSNQPLVHGLSQYSQHGLPTHVDSPPVQNPTQTQHTSQNQTLGSYYRQHEYGFSPSNQSLLSQHASQQQGGPQGQQEQGGYSAFSNLAQSFNQGQDFTGFNEPRGFYDGYQSTGFNSRNFLGPDDHGKPSPSHQSQQPSQSQTHPLTSGGGPGGSGSSSQGQSANGPNQSGQQGYPPPLPYYYPNPYYSQPNPYYSGPNPGYGVGMGQPFMNVKYPVYPPPGPGPATPTGGGNKGVTQSGPPGPNSYNPSGLYSGPHHHPGTYDDLNYGPPHQQHHQQHQGNQPNSSTDYGKPPLYGLNHAQGFLGQPSSVGRHAHPQSNPSPENTLRGYSGQPGSNVGNKPGDTPTRGQPMYTGGASATGVSRFNGPLASAAGPQQGQGQGNYPQSGGENNYYQQYQRPQYWH